MIIDSHQHFWNLDEVAYDWLVPDYGPIYRNFGPDDLQPLLRSAGVDRTVLVQAANSFEDTDAMLANAAAHDFIAAVVGWLPLENAAAAREALETRYAGAELLKGVRHLNHDEPDADWLLRPNVLDGIKVLEAHKLVYEVVAVYPLHLPHVPAIAAACPELVIVVDHLGKPPLASGGIEDWKANLKNVAAVENAYAKVSGLDTVADRENWNAGDLLAPIACALDIFGADRLMCGSDWPVSVLAGGYEKVWNEMLKALEMLGVSEEENRALLGGTASRVYGIR